MKISKISIRNFRSINNEPVIIGFEKDKNIYTLIGPNNSGKTNILDAIGLGLDSSKFYRYLIEDTDFYNRDIDNEIEIVIELTDPLDYKDIHHNTCEITKFVFKAKKYMRGTEKGRFHADHYCAGRNAKSEYEFPLMDFERMYRKKTASGPEIINRKIPVKAKDELPRLGYVYYLEPHRLMTFFDISKGPLGRLFGIYRDDFPKSKNIYENKLTCKEAFDQKAEEIKKILRTKKLEEIEGSLLKNFAQYLDLDKTSGFKIHLGLPTPEQFIKNLVDLMVKENKDLEDLPILRLGAGYLSLFRMAALQTLAEVEEKGENIFLIEEPEAYLHPHLRRFFYKVLKRLAANGNQIICVTHSTEFVTLEDYRSIIKVSKENGKNTSIRQIPGNIDLDFSKVSRQLREKGNEEIYFSNCAILAEGQNDVAMLSVMFDKIDFELDIKSISVIDCGGKENIKKYITLCNELRIDCFAIFDHDRGNSTSMPETSVILQKLDGNKEKCYWFDKSLESELGLENKECNPEYIYSLLDPLSYEEIKKRFPKIIEATEKFSKKYAKNSKSKAKT